MLLQDKDLISPLIRERTNTPEAQGDFVKVWRECGELWGTVSRVWLALAFGFLLLFLHIVFSHLLVGA